MKARFNPLHSDVVKCFFEYKDVFNQIFDVSYITKQIYKINSGPLKNEYVLVEYLIILDDLPDDLFNIE